MASSTRSPSGDVTTRLGSVAVAGRVQQLPPRTQVPEKASEVRPGAQRGAGDSASTGVTLPRAERRQATSRTAGHYSVILRDCEVSGYSGSQDTRPTGTAPPAGGRPTGGHMTRIRGVVAMVAVLALT